MKIHRVLEHDAEPAQVYEMSTLEAFQERKCRDAGALSWDIAIARDGDTAVVKTKRTLPTDGFPSILRKLVPSGVTSTETISWGEPAADGSRTATLKVDMHGAPAKMAGTITLSPRPGGGAQVVVDAEFKATVPIIGGKIEKVAAPIIIGVIESEERTGQAWSADHA